MEKYNFEYDKEYEITDKIKEDLMSSCEIYDIVTILKSNSNIIEYTESKIKIKNLDESEMKLYELKTSIKQLKLDQKNYENTCKDLKDKIDRIKYRISVTSEKIDKLELQYEQVEAEILTKLS